MTAGRIHPTWDEKTVAGLNRWQANSRVHPFTCGNGHELVAGPEGWFCRECDYTQTWAWAFMSTYMPPL